MNSKQHSLYSIKAGLIACLFFSFSFFTGAHAQEWKFDAATQKAYDLALNLQTVQALQLLPTQRTAQEIYVASLAQALDLLVTEDKEKYALYEDIYEKHLEQKSTSTTVEDLFLKAELRLQWMAIYLKFGHELDAALNFRECYLIVQECKKQAPDFTPILKTSGVLEVIIGSLPDKYDWIVGLLGIKGSVDQGLNELQRVAQPGNPFFLEATVIHSIIQAYVLQNTDEAAKSLKDMQRLYSENKNVLFLAAAVAMKNSQSEEALTMLLSFEKLDHNKTIAYAHYLKGEAYLHKADYVSALSAYRLFINLYKGQNYIKDAHYKIGICYWLYGDLKSAQRAFKEAALVGTESAEADKYAAKSMAETLPNALLTKARYYTDGGYYKEAEALLESINPINITTTRDQVEYYYRKARLSHKTNNLSNATLMYGKVIDSSKENPWYFAPNSCLQLGYMAVDEGNTTSARDYFKKALGYARHPYKNSIDSKAKSALAQLKTRK